MIIGSNGLNFPYFTNIPSINNTTDFGDAIYLNFPHAVEGFTFTRYKYKIFSMNLPKYSLIAAMDNNRIIGNNNKIPWKAKGEQTLFKRITENSVVIMGRNTYESLPNGALPNRYNAVLSTDMHIMKHPVVLRSDSF